MGNAGQARLTDSVDSKAAADMDIVRQGMHYFCRSPGIGMITVRAVDAAMGDPTMFKVGREFGAWLELVPAQIGTGGRTQLLGLSKRGATTPRTLLLHGVISSVAHALLAHLGRDPVYVITACDRGPYSRSHPLHQASGSRHLVSNTNAWLTSASLS